jgi:hypothetical protein
MGLDIYVGPLTRYFAHDWKTIVQQAAEAQGKQVVVDRPTAPDAITDKERIRTAVRGWRTLIEHGLKGRLRGPLEWDETDDAPYFTDKPDFAGWHALQLLAGALASGRALPDTAPADWTKDRTWSSAVKKSQYRHVVEPFIWLPSEFDDVFVVKWLTGAQLPCGSSPRLLDQLRELNQSTLRGTPEDLEAWRQAGPAQPLTQMARFGLAVFTELAGQSVRARLPMVLDY